MALAKEWQAMLVVLHVLEGPDTSGLYDFRPVPSWRRPPDPAAAAREHLLADLGPAVARSRILIREGEPVETILATAQSEGCDLVVTGVAQDKEFGRFRLGRIVDRLLRRSRKPMLVVRKRPRGAYRNIVAATDFSDPARHALQMTVRLFPHRKLILFHAYDVPRQTLADNPVAIRKTCEDAVRGKCERFLKEVGPLGRNCTRPDVLIEEGNPGRLLREYAHVGKVDLVTLGTRGHSGLLDLFLGSTAREIVGNGACRCPRRARSGRLGRDMMTGRTPATTREDGAALHGPQREGATVGWIARFLLIAAGTVTGWFVARDAPNFGVIQLAVALLLLTFVVAVLAFRPTRWTVRHQRFSGLVQRPDGTLDRRGAGPKAVAGRKGGGSHDRP